MNKQEVKAAVATHILAAALGGYLVANSAGLSLMQKADAATTQPTTVATQPASAEGKAP